MLRISTAVTFHRLMTANHVCSLIVRLPESMWLFGLNILPIDNWG